ncbi:MAG: efflux RND transporter periplasmic adaptor subunit [Candidatus Gracilibacteria bacterium]|nr:efflux RND transporter periplasmic adaptor subunit [Candidatus Gracilibacteria bacterium]
MSILSEIQSRKKNRRTVVIVLIVVVFVLFYALYVWFFASKKEGDLLYKTHIISSGSIVETISGDGKSLYRGYYNLSLPLSGKVAIVHKKDGEKVGKNEAIVSLDDTYLRINLEKSEIALQNARANLIAKEASAPSIEEIRITEEQLKQAMLALENTKRQTNSDTLVAKQSLETALVSFHSAENDLSATENDTKIHLQNTLNSVAIAEKELQNAENDLQRVISDGSGSLHNLREKGFIAIDAMTSMLAKDLEDMDNLLGVTDANRNKNDAFETYLGAKDFGTKSRAETAFRTAKSAFDAFMADWNRIRANPPYAETISWMDSVYSISMLVSNSLTETLATLRNSISSSSFPQTSIDTSITLFDSELSALNSQNNLFVTERQAIATKETNLTTDEKTHRDTISVLASRLDLAKGELEKAKSSTYLLLSASQAKFDLAKKQVESIELQYITVVKQGKDNISTVSKQVDIARASLDAKKKRTSQEELAPYQISIHTAQNVVKEAKQRLHDSILRSPIDGMIVKIDTLVGEEVTIGIPFVSLVDTEHPYVESDMEEIDIAKVRLGQPVRIIFDALDDVSLTGSVTFISPSSLIDANGIVTYRVDIAFEPGMTNVREGMSATVEYIVREANDVLVVPTNFLSETDGKYSLFSIDRNMSIPVEIGISDGKMTEVRSGMKMGEKVREK